MAASSTLPYFWQLASASTSERLDASYKLVSALQGSAGNESEKTSAATGQLFDDGFAKSATAEQVTNEEIDAAEAGLTSSLNGEVAYAVRRLIKGLASHRESARLGFSVALAEILAQHTTLAPRHALVLILAYSRTTAKMRGQEERDLLFARLFGVATLVRSDTLTRKGRATLEDWQRAMDVLFALGRTKTWLRESAAAVVVSALELWQQADESSTPDWQGQAQTWLADKICSEKAATPEAVAIFLMLRATAADKLKASHRLPHFASQDLLAPANLSALARVLCGQSPKGTDRQDDEDDDLELDTGAQQGPTGSSSVRAHFVWDTILSLAMTGKGKQASFADIYRALVDESLFAPNASHQKKAWGFQVLERALRIVDAERLPQIFTPNLMRTLINHLSAKDRVLHRAAQKVTGTMQDAVKDRPEIGNIIIAQLTGPLGTQRFDAATGTKTVEGILRKMQAQDVRKYVHSIIASVCSDLADSQRKLLLDQLLIVVRNGQIATSDECNASILEFLAGHGFFNVKKGEQRKKSGDTAIPIPPFSASVQSACRSRLLSCVSDLYGATSSESDAKSNPGAGSTNWIINAYEILDQLSKDDAHYSALPAAESDIVDAALEMKSRLSAAQSKSTDAKTRQGIVDFESALLATLLYVRSDLISAASSSSSVSTSDRASELLEPLIDCGDRLLLGKKQAPGEPDVGELLVHCLATLMEEQTALLRAVATQAFNTFSHKITRGAIKQLVHLLGFDAEGTEKDESAEASEEEDEDDDDEAMSDSMSETSATSSSSDDEDEPSEIDEKFAAEVRDALKAGGIADQDDEEDGSDDGEDDADDNDDGSSEASVASDFDDDQMMLVDDKLADIFRQKFASRKEQDAAKKETVAFHIKIVDLLDNFVKQQGASPLCVDIVLPLLTVTMEKDPAMDQLKARAASVLQKTFGKSKQWPTDVFAPELVPALEAIHKLATTGAATGQQAQLVTACNVYLTRAASRDALQGDVARVYKDTLDDFITRRASNLKPQFLIDAFARFPVLGYHLRTQLLEAASGPQQNSQHSFRQLQALEMLRVALSNLVAGQQGAAAASAIAPDELIDTLTPLLTQVRQLILARASHDDLRIKELLKAGLQFVRLTKKLAEKKGGNTDALLQQVWPAEEIDASVAALGTTHVLANAASLQSLLRQMSAIVAPATTTTGSSKKRAAVQTASSPASKAQAKTDASATAPKTKKARRSESK